LNFVGFDTFAQNYVKIVTLDHGLQPFKTYDFSTVVLRKEDIDSAIEVFTRINTGGQTLTLFEIISAKTYGLFVVSSGFEQITNRRGD